MARRCTLTGRGIHPPRILSAFCCSARTGSPPGWIAIALVGAGCLNTIVSFVVVCADGGYAIGEDMFVVGVRGAIARCYIFGSTTEHREVGRHRCHASQPRASRMSRFEYMHRDLYRNTHSGYSCPIAAGQTQWQNGICIRHSTACGLSAHLDLGFNHTTTNHHASPRVFFASPERYLIRVQHKI